MEAAASPSTTPPYQRAAEAAADRCAPYANDPRWCRVGRRPARRPPGLLFGVWRSVVPTKLHASSERATLADARQAYLDGDFEACLALCDDLHGRDEATRFEIAILRARIHVRVDRGDRALDVLRTIDSALLSDDEFVVAQTLLGAAYVRLGQKERGAAILAETFAKANPADATVRAELSLQLAIAKFRLGDYEQADRLLEGIGVEHDTVHAHALEYRGWVAQARSEFGQAAQWFREALAALSVCKRRDRYVEGKSLFGLIAISPELLRMDDWSLIERRVRRFDWSLDGLSPWRYWIQVSSSMMCEIMGDLPGARRWARRAETLARSDGYRVIALSRLAAVFRGLRQTDAQHEFVERALDMYETLDLRDLSADIQHLPLFLAEEVAHTTARDDADMLLAQYREVVLPGLKSTSGGLEQFVALERLIEGVLYEARGENNKAVRAFTLSYRTLSRLGYRRRATSVALRLARLTGNARYVAYVEDALSRTSPRFWMTRDLLEIRGGTGPALTETESGILRLIAQGKTYKEIAAARSVSVKTIGNHVQALFRKFDVHSRGELAAEAFRHRVVTPHHPAGNAAF